MNTQKFNRNQLESALDGSVFMSEVFEKLGYSRNPNASVRRRIQKEFDYFSIDNKAVLKKNRTHVLICPVCGTEFTIRRKENQTTCSHACSNTYFRSGINNPNWKEDFYRSTCFYYHKKECVVCGEDKIVEVHHLDHNHDNNSPDNLIPLCPTHHQYWHSGYQHIIREHVMDYAERFKSFNSDHNMGL